MSDADSDDLLGPYLHWSFMGSVILLPSIQLNTFSGFLIGSLLTIAVCVSERLLALLSEKQWAPSSVKHSRWKHAAWRSMLYWMTTFLRLMYMLIAMSFQLGIIIVIVTTLSIAQFFIEYHKGAIPPHQQMGVHGLHQPLLDRNGPESPYPLLPRTRPGPKTRPGGLFIHPNESNIARADAVALELGYASSSSSNPDHYADEEVWEKQHAASRKSQNPVRDPFRISDEDEDGST
ncbi:hypothetical protein PC9H_003238 [Pleurotus ostreatus]|uniref:Copper transport protein n=1 Tax=Pleurotus ostreatus TaxID=5322 RepID=A0A8H6ZXY3_PLEOS|nr:uncharacterized protein PC9H_003238 [Pleurotus ostreatus]KAF7436405.1 hypothetical protein PC9H_003238 [Pleurotus ostreatus]